MSSYTAPERETSLQTDDESGFWKLETYQSKIVTKLKKVGIEPISVREDGQYLYELDFAQVSFRSGKKREMSEEQRERQREHMKKMHEAKKKGEIE